MMGAVAAACPYASAADAPSQGGPQAAALPAVAGPAAAARPQLTASAAQLCLSRGHGGHGTGSDADDIIDPWLELDLMRGQILLLLQVSTPAPTGCAIDWAALSEVTLRRAQGCVCAALFILLDNLGELDG
jgi:hypothetical protein